MALIKCKECGREISDQATSCPGCGAPVSVYKEPPIGQKRKLSIIEKIGLFFLCGIGLLIIYAFFADTSTPTHTTTSTRPRPTASPTPDDIDLNASVRFQDNIFIITNNDSFDWRNIRLTINGGVFKGYELKHGLIQSGAVYEVGSMQFADSDGQRFNPFTMKPQSFWIACDTPQGRGFWAGGWN